MKLLSVFPFLTQFLFLIPITAGLFGVFLPAFGFFPDLGGTSFHLGEFQQLLAHPSLPQSVGLTFFTGIAATCISFYFAARLAAYCSYSAANQSQNNKKINWFQILHQSLIPIIAIPHAAMALGLAFLMAPSGWIIRLFTSWFSGWETPPEIITIQDPWGFSLIAGLVLKETPYLWLMMLAATPQIKTQDYIQIGQSLGYGVYQSWKKLVLPQMYPLIRLPLYAVLAFSLSVVDVALILGPTTPPTLSLLLMRWIDHPDLSFRFLASAGAVLLLMMTLAALFLAWILERMFLHYWKNWMSNGKRGSGRQGQAFPRFIMILILAFSSMSVFVLWLWSFSLRWPYPHVLPSIWSLRNWERHWFSLQETAITTLAVGLLSVIVALILVMGCLENEQWNHKHFSSRALWLLFLPLLIPQATFFLGIQILSVKLRLDGTFLLLVWGHLLFVLPYVFLSLGDSWRNLDSRYTTIAQCLGSSKWKIFLYIKMPLLLKPILFASAIGFAVSISQYLPTLFAGGGRFNTLTTEAVSYAASADRRLIGVYGFLQALFPWVALILATAIPRWKFRFRAALN